MSADEEVARRYARRSGFTLVSYRPVAVPIFRATLQVLLLAKKPLPPIPEFILRAIDCGVDTPVEVGALLGLEQPVIDAGLRMLLHSDDVLIGAPAESRRHRVVLTQKGRQSLETVQRIAPEEVSYQVDIDGMTRKAIPFLGPKAIRPVEVGKEGLIELPANPRSKPTFDELSMQVRDYHTWLQREGQDRERDLIEMLAITRIERLFRTDALILLYKAENGEELQAALTVDEVLSPEHTAAFASVNRESLRQLVPDALVPDGDVPGAEVLYDPALCEQSRGMTGSLRAQTNRAFQQIADLTGRLRETDSISEKAVLREQLAAVQENVGRLQAELDSIQVHDVEVYEHAAYLYDALEKATRRLMIISPWIKGKVVNEQFLKSLEGTLERAVPVYVGYGLDGENARETERDRHAVSRLENLAKRHPNFHFVRFGDTHAKILVCDDWYIGTSFNWLSFRGDPRLPFRDERGTFVRLPHAVEDLFNSYLSRF